METIATRRFVVAFTRFGYHLAGRWYPAAHMQTSVTADSPREAVRLAKARYRRADKFRVVKDERA